MSFFELNDLFGYQDANDIKKFWAAVTAPASPGEGEVWLDISETPNLLKRYNGTAWVAIAGNSASDMLTLLKTVDGSSSGLDADKLDAQEGSFYRNAANLNAGVIPAARIAAADLLTLLKTVDGTGSGLDADTLDGQEGSYYQNAANLNAGTIPAARLAGSDLLTLIKTVDGLGSGLDADLLGGQDNSYYLNASNINSGTLTRARMADIGNVNNPYICAGKVNVTVEWQSINFPAAYTSTPFVVVSADETRIVRISTISTTCFQVLRTIPDYPTYTPEAGYVYWIAFGNRI